MRQLELDGKLRIACPPIFDEFQDEGPIDIVYHEPFRSLPELLHALVLRAGREISHSGPVTLNWLENQAGLDGLERVHGPDGLDRRQEMRNVPATQFNNQPEGSRRRDHEGSLGKLSKP